MPNLWMPMVRVSLSDSIDLNVQNVVNDDIVALVDTGSDYCRIDVEFVKKYPNLKQLGEMKAASPTGTAIEKMYAAQIIIDGHPVPTICLSAPLREVGNQFDLLLGMDVIRHFELSVIRSHPLVTLSWVAP
jgi:hypothetical protein